MWDRAFVNRLRKELPDWIEKGWVTPAGEAAIVGAAEARVAQGIHVIPIALAVIGALTLGAGIILFFAANWDEMPKIAKLIVLFGSMWIAYAIAGRGLSGSARASGVIAHAMLLLGVILFGANIQLIAQIYHIDAHYPNGVLMWSLGALVLIWAVPSQPAAVAGIALATLWSGMETLDFGQQVHWPFLGVWALFAAPALYRGWKWATCAALVSLGVWCFTIIIDWPYDERGQSLYLLQVFTLLGVAIHLAGRAMQNIPRLASLSAVVRRTALIGALFAAHFFIYVGVHGLPWYSWTGRDFNAETWARAAEAGPGIIAFIAVFALAALALAVERYRRVAAAHSRRDMAGIALAGLAAAVMLANPFMPGRYADAVLMYVAINGTFFAVLVWMVVDGYRSGERFQVYSAFVAYGAGMLSVYFMNFFTLMERSLFVMGGGAVLIAGVYILERQRRQTYTAEAGGAS
ncbi:MAG: DUF2157 domain-containing protein [Proteobacteria bacterium]|nr:DUF2157 domain-containing protein [Pseudomonadota bacterium]